MTVIWGMERKKSEYSFLKLVHEPCGQMQHNPAVNPQKLESKAVRIVLLRRPD